MSFSQKRVLSHAVMASSLLWFGQAAHAVVDITTNVSNPVTIDSADLVPVGSKDTFIRVSGGSVAVANQSAIIFSPSAAIGTGTLTVEKSNTSRGIEIDSQASAINFTALNATTSVVNIQKSATVRSTGTAATILDSSTVANVLTINNDGNIINTATGKAIVTNANSNSFTLNNTANGVITAGTNATAIDLTNIGAAGVRTITNAGAINAPSGTAILSKNQVIDNFTNSGTISGVGTVIDFNGQASPVTITGGSIRSNLETNTAIDTSGLITISGGSVTGKMITTGGITFNLGNSGIFTTGGDLSINVSALTLNSGTLVLNHNISNFAGATVTIASGATFRTSNIRQISTDFIANPGSNINLDLVSTTAFGSIRNGSFGNNFSGANFIITNNGNGYIADNAFLKILQTGSFTSDNATTFSVPTSAVYTFTVNRDAPSDVFVLVRRKALNTFGSPYTQGLTREVGLTLENLGLANTTDTRFLEVLGELGRLTTAIAVEDGLRQLVPPTNLMEMQAAVNTSSQVMNVISNRLSLARLNDEGSDVEGYSAGNMNDGAGVWGQLFANRSSQRSVKGIYGYKGDTVGFALGTDAMTSDSMRMGFSIGAATTDLKNRGRPRVKDDMKNYQATLYASVDKGCHWYEAMLSYSALRHKVNRPISIGALNTGATNKHRGTEWTSRLGIGKGLGRLAGWEVSPFASLTWNHITEHAYREHGAGSISLSVQPHDVDVFNLNGKLGAQRTFMTSLGNLSPSAYLGMGYDVYSRRDTVNAQFVGGGNVFKVVGLQPSKFGVDAGAALSLASHKDGTLSLSYDVKKRRDYFAHTGFLTVRYAL